MDKNEITAVIPTEGVVGWKNDSLLYTIKCLQAQTDVKIDIIIATTNPSNEFIEEMKSENVTVVSCNLKFCGERRNFGASHAKTDKLLFIDDDTIVLARDALSQICSLLNYYDFVCGAHRYWSSYYWHKYISLMLSHSAMKTILENISILPRGINRAFGFRQEFRS